MGSETPLAPDSALAKYTFWNHREKTPLILRKANAYDLNVEKFGYMVPSEEKLAEGEAAFDREMNSMLAEAPAQISKLVDSIKPPML